MCRCTSHCNDSRLLGPPPPASLCRCVPRPPDPLEPTAGNSLHQPGQGPREHLRPAAELSVPGGAGGGLCGQSPVWGGGRSGRVLGGRRTFPSVPSVCLRCPEEGAFARQPRTAQSWGRAEMSQSPCCWRPGRVLRRLTFSRFRGRSRGIGGGSAVAGRSRCTVPHSKAAAAAPWVCRSCPASD